MNDYSESPLTTGAGFWELVREDYARHGRDSSKPGFRALLVYRFGVWRMRVRSKLLRFPLSFIYRRLFHHVRNHYGIELPFSAKVGRRVVIEHQSGIVIHGNCVIGNECYIRQGVTMGNKNIDRPGDAPILGDRVNVGAGAKLLGKINVGDDAQIGANAVLTKDVPAEAIALGIPATIHLRRPASSAESGA